MSGPSVHYLLESFVNQLYFCGDNDETERICQRMKSVIDEQARLLPTSMFSNLISKLVESGILLLNYDIKDWRLKSVGLLILDRLLDVNIEIMAERRIEIVNQLRKVLEFDKLPLETYATVLQRAAISIGHLARVASTTEIEYLQDYYVSNSIKWLRDTKLETRRYAGAVLIAELAVNSPALIFVCRKNFFTSIWDVIFDRNERLRVAAARALSAALVLVGQREHLGEYLVKCMNQIDIGFTINTTEKVHGSLLILECLITDSVVASESFLENMKAMSKPLPEFFMSVFERKDNRDPLVRAKIIEIIPQLADMSPNTFITSKYDSKLTFLAYSVNFFIRTIEKGKDRPLAFTALGKLFVAISHSTVGVAGIESDIFETIQTGFSGNFCVEALRCVGMVVQVSRNSRHYIKEQFVDGMFNGGLTADLISSLKVVTRNVAQVRSFVQSRLRSLITNILLSHSIVLEPIPMNASPRQPPVGSGNKTPVGRRGSVVPTASPLTASSTQHQGFFRDFFSGNTPSVTGLHIRKRLFGVGNQGVASDIATDEELILALEVLATFDFISRQRQMHLSEMVGMPERTLALQRDSGNKSRAECSTLLRVVREGVVRYLDDSNPAIRAAAAVTCAVVMDKVVKSVDADVEMEECLLQIMGRLLMLGVGDDISGNRIAVFISLTPALDHVITASDCVNCLVDSLNDESFEVRTAAMTVLSRVAHFDNVHVMPLARTILSKIMQQLQDSKDPQMQSESVQMLRAMAVGMDKLIIPYIPLLLSPLLELLSIKVTDICCSALATIGELSKSSPKDVRPHLDKIFPAIIGLIESESMLPEHMDTIMLALCNIASSLSLVAEPYARFPELFGCIVKVIHKTDASFASSRLLAIRAIGLMGAVSSSLYSSSGIRGGLDNYSTTTLYSDEKKDSKTKAAQGDLSLVAETLDDDDDDKLISLDKYYVGVVMQSLTNILSDDSLATHHQTVMKVAMVIVKILGSQGITYLDGFVKAVVAQVYSADSKAVQESLLTSLVEIIHVFQAGIIRHLSLIIKLSCDMVNLYVQICMDIIEALCSLTPPQHYNRALREMFPLMIHMIRTELMQDTTEPTVGNLSVADMAAQLNSAVSSESPARQSGVRSNSDAPPLQAGQLSRGSSNISTLTVSNDGRRKPMAQTRIMLKTIANVASFLREYTVQLIPIVLSVMEDKMVLADVRREALCVAMHLATDAREMQLYAGRLIHSILRLLDSEVPILKSSGFIALSTILCRIGPAFLPFVVTAKRKISSIIQREGMIRLPQMEEYEALLNRLLNQLPLPSEPSDSSLNFMKSRARIKMLSDNARSTHKSNVMNIDSLKTAWTLSGRITSSDLVEWMRRLSIELIRQSPSPIIHPCAVLAKVYQPLATELFNAAFVSVWTEYFSNSSSYIEFSDDLDLISSLETALTSPQIPENIRTAILNLAEFLEMQGKQLPIDLLLLANQSQASNQFAKCLHYREIEFSSKIMTPSKECIEALITVNRQLDLGDAATGLLEVVRTRFSDSIPIQPRWLERLHCWEEAKMLYLTNMNEEDARDSSSKFGVKPYVKAGDNLNIGLLRCMRALGDHVDLAEKATSLYKDLEVVEAHFLDSDLEDSTEARLEVQRLGAHAAWMLGQWDNVEEFLDGPARQSSSANAVSTNRRDLTSHSIDLENNSSFYYTLLAIHKRKYPKALNLINDTREELTKSFSSLLSESYSRAYRAMVSMQLLTELEEVVMFNEYVEGAMAAHNAAKANLDPSVGITVMISDDLLADIADKKSAIMYKWRARMQSAPREVDIFRQILNVHSLLLTPSEDLDSWLELVNLCMSRNMLVYCENILRSLGAPLVSMAGSAAVADASVVPPHPRVLYHTYKYIWITGDRVKALAHLSEFLSGMDMVPVETEARELKVKCLLKKAEWTKLITEASFSTSDDVLSAKIGVDILAMVREARDLATDQYSVWHAWAVTNFDQLQIAEAGIASAVNGVGCDNEGEEFLDIKARLRSISIKDDLSERLKSAERRNHRRSKSLSGFQFIEISDLPSMESTSTNLIIEAIKGFVRSIMLGRDQPVANVLQDILRLLTLWFSYATRKEIFVVLNDELENIPAENWLGVVPQLIARMHVRVPEVAGPLRRLLMKVSAAHPQALVCPVSVAMNTSDFQRKSLAFDIINAMRKSEPRLVDDATMVSKELMRVAITAHEFWHQGLERAAHLYIVEKDVNGMIQVLSQLHGLDSGAGFNADGSDANSGKNSRSFPIFSEVENTHAGYTLRDLSFQNNFGRDLSSANEWLLKFKTQKRNLFLLHQAWGIYYDVFKKIALQLKNFTAVQLSHVSPALTEASSLSLAVPGTYEPFKDIVCISKFAASVDVIASKQRPRRITITGSDGRKYRFLLKGHEDLRQDERVMQLFGLINACLENRRSTSHMGLKIVRYSVLPLSNNSGLIGWVENCDTLNQLIKMYRETRNIKLNVEHRLLMEKNPNYEKLPFIQKICAFQDVLDTTKGEDIAKMLFLKSKTSEMWIGRRTNYTKSLAVNSMAGYILGLGDRHPSNLMLDRITGRIVHIDFGDCFEVAQNRSKYPEKIPFRLTRMLVNAMESSGIEGTYRSTCQRVMSTLRDNKDSVMAMLEAFVYDPLISWRLMADSGAGGEVRAADVTHSNNEVVPDGHSRSTVDALLTDLKHSMSVSNDIMLAEDRKLAAREIKGMDNTPIDGLMSQQMTNSAIVGDSPKDEAKYQKLIAAESDKNLNLENLNTRAMEVILRIQSKLCGRDFNRDPSAGGDELTVDEQVERLIQEAVSVENLCELFVGWCPFW